MENQGKKLAVLVGINYTHEYPQSRASSLKGCINDVEAMKEVLVGRFGFDPSHIEVLTDGPEAQIMPTGANIMKALNWMVDKALDDDILFFHFSGHGVRGPMDPNHPEKFDEAIYPCDANLIYDEDFRRLVNRVPVRATFTILADSCHSGELIAEEKEQIGPSIHTRDSTEPPLVNQKSRFIPFETVLQDLSSQTGLNTPNIGTHLLALFGSEASLKFHQPDTDMDTQCLSDGGILLSGCQKDEFSQDLSPGGSVPITKPCGAFSNAVQIVLQKHEGPITNKELVMKTRELLQEQKLDTQHPCLYCSDNNAMTNFLMQQRNV